MSEKDERLKLAEKDKNEKQEGKRSLLILSQVIALIICILLSFSVWLVVHYREDKKNDPPATDGEANSGYSDVITVQ